MTFKNRRNGQQCSAANPRRPARPGMFRRHKVWVQPTHSGSTRRRGTTTAASQYYWGNRSLKQTGVASVSRAPRKPNGANTTCRAAATDQCRQPGRFAIEPRSTDVCMARKIRPQACLDNFGITTQRHAPGETSRGRSQSRSRCKRARRTLYTSCGAGHAKLARRARVSRRPIQRSRNRSARGAVKSSLKPGSSVCSIQGCKMNMASRKKQLVNLTRARHIGECRPCAKGTTRAQNRKRRTKRAIGARRALGLSRGGRVGRAPVARLTRARNGTLAIRRAIASRRATRALQLRLTRVDKAGARTNSEQRRETKKD